MLTLLMITFHQSTYSRIFSTIVKLLRVIVAVTPTFFWDTLYLIQKCAYHYHSTGFIHTLTMVKLFHLVESNTEKTLKISVFGGFQVDLVLFGFVLKKIQNFKIFIIFE